MIEQRAYAASHDFMQVARLVPTTQQVTAVPVGTQVRQALELMGREGFDQLPVMAAGRVVGVFSYRSLARALKYLRRNDDPLDQPVEDCVEEPGYVRASHDVGEILALLEKDGAVLVGEESHVDAVMTSTDVMRYLWSATHPFVLLQDIELSARSLMYQCCAEPGVLEQALRRGLQAGRFDDPTGQPSRLEDLSYAELLGVLLQSESFGRLFADAFGRNKTLVAATLEPVREVRNKVFHFRDEISAEELDVLVVARQYLRRRVTAAKARRS